jgi:DNA-binding NtrC family response regulator
VAEDDRSDLITKSNEKRRPTARASGEPALRVLFVTLDETRFQPLREGDEYVIGRVTPEPPAAAPDVVPILFADELVSRRHARLALRGGVLTVEDLRSRNGTFVNEAVVPIGAGAPAPLAAGDAFAFGDVVAWVLRQVPGVPEPQCLVGHDALMDALAREIVHARHCARTLALLYLRAADEVRGQPVAHAARWFPRLRPLVPDVDRVSFYGPESVLLLHPEATPDEALQFARVLTGNRRAGEAPLRCGLAFYPTCGLTPPVLEQAARAAAARATAKAPISPALPIGRPGTGTGTGTGTGVGTGTGTGTAAARVTETVAEAESGSVSAQARARRSRSVHSAEADADAEVEAEAEAEAEADADADAAAEAEAAEAEAHASPARRSPARRTAERPPARAPRASAPASPPSPAGGAGAAASAPILISPRMREIHDQLVRVADAPTPILLLGETGVGKDVLARLLHERSVRRARPFLAVNCGALARNLVESELFGHVRGAFSDATHDAPGVFAAARGGTVFLDEIGELPLDVQPKLLRVIAARAVRPVGAPDERPCDFRLVLATHRDLEVLITLGTFREDLYHRIATLPLTIPPLRDRPEEILPLAAHFLAQFSSLTPSPLRGFTPAAQTALLQHSWPGNVRELQSAIERAALLSTGPEVDAPALSLRIRTSAPVPPPLAAPPDPTRPVPADYQARRDLEEKELLLTTLKATSHNRSEAARLLHIDRHTLVRRATKLGVPLDPPKNRKKVP